MTARTPLPVSDDSSPEAPSPFCGDQDEEPNPLLAVYEQLCPGGLDEGAIEEDTRAAEQARVVEQPAGSAAEAAAEATAEEEQGEKKKKRRKKGCSRFKQKPKGKRWSAHVPVSPGSRKRAPQQRRRRKVPVPAAYKEVDCRVIPQREMRDCISSYYLAVLGAPPPEEWRGEGGTVSEIARALRLNKNQRRRVLNVIVRTHHAMLTGAEYDSMREFRAGSVVIKLDSVE